MICKKCGTDNPDYYIFCQNCFADLSDENASASKSGGEVVEKEIYQSTPQTVPVERERPQQPNRKQTEKVEFVKDETARERPRRSSSNVQSESFKPEASSPSASQNRLHRPRSDQQNKTILSNQTEDATVTNFTNDIPTKARKSKSKTEHEANELKKLQENSSSEYYDYYDYYDETALKREKRRTNIVGIIIAGAVVIVLGVGLFLGYRYAVNNYGSVGAMFGGGSSEVVVEKTVTPDGYPSHTIIIPLKAGDTVQFLDESLSAQAPIIAQGNVAQPIEIQDSAMIPVNPNPNEATISVKPNIVVTSADGTQKPVEFAPYTVEVPQVQLVISQPTSLENVSSEGSTLTIIGQAYADGSPVQVLINNQFQPEMDPSGAFIAEIPLSGAFEVNVQALASQYRANNAIITGSMALGADGTISLLDAEYENQPTTESSMLISGTTALNSNLTIPGAQNLQYDPLTGKFSFTAPLLTIGQHQFTMTLADGASQTLTLTKIPNVDSFWSAAKALDYDAAIKSPDNSIKQSVYFDGFIEAIDDSGVAPVYTISLRSDPSKKLRVEYLGVTKPNMNDVIWVFGDIKSVDPESTTPITVESYFFYDAITMQQIRNGALPTDSTSSDVTDVSTDITNVSDASDSQD